MSCDSHDNSCMSGAHSHGSSCGGNQCKCSCHSCTCCSGHHDEQANCSDKAKHLLEVADMAWMELLKEKIKEHIANSDHKIDELAKIVAEANRERWHQKMAKAKNCEQYERKLSELFGCGDSKCK